MKQHYAVAIQTRSICYRKPLHNNKVCQSDFWLPKKKHTQNKNHTHEPALWPRASDENTTNSRHWADLSYSSITTRQEEVIIGRVLLFHLTAVPWIPTGRRWGRRSDRCAVVRCELVKYISIQGNSSASIAPLSPSIHPYSSGRCKWRVGIRMCKKTARCI